MSKYHIIIIYINNNNKMIKLIKRMKNNRKNKKKNFKTINKRKKLVLAKQKNKIRLIQILKIKRENQNY